MSKQSREQSRSERAAAIRVAQARKERNRRVALVAGIVVVLGAIVAAGTWYSGGGSSNTSGSDKGSQSVSAGSTYLKVGSSEAPVKIVVYEDFLCPYCRELEASTRDFLRANADKGKVYVEYRPINLLRQYAYSAKALNAWAAVLAHASPQAALKLHDLFYDKQPYEQAADQVTDAQIAAWVKEAGGDNAQVRDAMAAKDTSFFDATNAEMAQKKITGTPTVFINGKELPISAVTQMTSQIETAVEQGNK